MAICLHKLINRASGIAPILNQSRQFGISTNCLAPFNAPSRPQQAVQDQISKTNALTKRGPTFVQPAAFLSRSTSNLNNESTNDGDANEEKLAEVYDALRKELPLFFVSHMNYKYLHKDIVFENRIRGKTYYGAVDYIKQMTYIRFYCHFMYAYVKLDVLKMTKHPEDSSVRVRWRISGISGYRVLFKMLQLRVWRPKEMIEQHQLPWIDGFSTFYVNSEGRIVRHIADKVMPDEDKEPNPIQKVVDKMGQNVPKLALVVKLSTDIAPSMV